MDLYGKIWSFDKTRPTLGFSPTTSYEDSPTWAEEQNLLQSELSGCKIWRDAAWSPNNRGDYYDPFVFSVENEKTSPVIGLMSQGQKITFVGPHYPRIPPVLSKLPL